MSSVNIQARVRRLVFPHVTSNDKMKDPLFKRHLRKESETSRAIQALGQSLGELRDASEHNAKSRIVGQVRVCNVSIA
jgi:hypothetical protein